MIGYLHTDNSLKFKFILISFKLILSLCSMLNNLIHTLFNLNKEIFENEMK